jgi:ElaB/YqjD/DUF883 family membrane-anchored ribosome-binding protein
MTMSQETTDKLLEDLRAVIHDAEELLKATAGLAGEHIEKVRARAEASLQTARARLSSLGACGSGQVHDAMRTTDNYVRRNPWVAVGAAAVAGMLVGVLAGRRPGRLD